MLRKIINQITRLHESVIKQKHNAALELQEAVKNKKDKKLIADLKSNFDYVNGQEYELSYILDLIWNRIEENK